MAGVAYLIYRACVRQHVVMTQPQNPSIMITSPAGFSSVHNLQQVQHLQPMHQLQPVQYLQPQQPQNTEPQPSIVGPGNQPSFFDKVFGTPMESQQSQIPVTYNMD